MTYMTFPSRLLAGAFIVAFSFLNTALHGQSSNNPKLDEHRNFKLIQLEDSFQKWSEHLSYTGSSENGAKHYDFNTGHCCSKMFGEDVEWISVVTKDNVIVAIEIGLEKYQTSMTDLDRGWKYFEDLQSQFSALFGNYYGTDMTEGNRITEWQGARTILHLHYDYLGVVNGDRVRARITDKDYLMSVIGAGF